MLRLTPCQKLEAWQKENKIQLSQVNGQRKYGGPPDEWEGPVPGAGCEVFISQIPRETFEDRLIPLFSVVGPLWEFRLMMNFSGMNRGFAYAKYGSHALAAAAVSRLHGVALEPGVHLSVRHSIEKSQLLIGELPENTQWAGLMQVLRSLSEGVEGLTLKSEPAVKGVSALVIYVSHHAASMAKKVLVEGFQKLFSLKVSVKWQHLHPKGRGPLADGARPLCLRHPRSPAETFNKAPGAPVSMLPPPSSPDPVETPLGAKKAVCALSLLQQVHGATPVMHLEFSSIDWAGRIHVTYEVHLHGPGDPFSGTLTARVSTSAADTMSEVRELVARQVLASIEALPCQPENTWPVPRSDEPHHKYVMPQT
ncbi:unnamed protein product [Lota lota]